MNANEEKRKLRQTLQI